ncbi:MAG TPA: hypothetical protein VI078_01515, partial [bacterium]
MPIIPIRKIPALQEFAVSTCGTITRGTALTMSAAGFLTNTITGYATNAPFAAVAAEAKATASSLLQSNKIKCWQIQPETLWEATVSGSGSSVGIGSLVHLKNAGTGIQYSATTVTTGGCFIIEGF